MTVAPATSTPPSSVILPLIDDVVTCANAVTAANRLTKVKAIFLIDLFIGVECVCVINCIFIAKKFKKICISKFLL